MQKFLEKICPAILVCVKSFEILIVDGGSRDGTAEIAKKFGARVHLQSRPGYGNAYREGIALAKGKYILTMDADSSHPVEIFQEFWRLREHYTVVMVLVISQGVLMPAHGVGGC